MFFNHEFILDWASFGARLQRRQSLTYAKSERVSLETPQIHPTNYKMDRTRTKIWFLPEVVKLIVSEVWGSDLK